MAEPLFRPVPMLDLTLPAVPARSRLYPLEPIGVGTPLVESLTSYLTRLAYAHKVTVEILAAREIAPLIGRRGPAAWAKFNSASYNLNGLEAWTAWTLTALAELTLRSDLTFLTMQPWGKVLARPNLLRRHLAWCPTCYSEWRQAGQALYVPLLWTLKPGGLCPQHQQPLSDRCPYPDCGQALRLINSRVPLGYCPACRRWLGLPAETSGANKALWSDCEKPEQGWLTDQLARLLATTPTLAASADHPLFVRNFKRCLAASPLGNVQRLAKEMGLSPSVVFGWLRRGHPPQLGLLAQACQLFGVAVLDMLTVQPGQDDDPLPPEASVLPPVKIAVETAELRRRLAGILDDPQASPGSASQVARQMGVTAAIIKGHCPEQYQQILHRHAQAQQAHRQSRNQKLAADLQVILAEEEFPPPSLFEVARRLKINPRTARSNCPDLCRAICRKRTMFLKLLRFLALRVLSHSPAMVSHPQMRA